jgi:hypothetical protein
MSLDDVVAEYHANRFARGKVFDETERFGNPALAFLVSVVEVLQAKRFAVSEQSQKIASRTASGDDHDVMNAGVDKGLNGVKDHRLVVDRQQMFVCDGGKRTQSRP